MNTFGQKLKEARKAKNLTQKQLADKIGAKHNSISNWENNQNKPDPDTIELICGVLDVTPNYLLGVKYKEHISISREEQNHLYKYRSIDNKGKHTVDTVLEMEYIRCNKPHLMVNAAHAIEGASEEDQQHDEELLKQFLKED